MILNAKEILKQLYNCCDLIEGCSTATKSRGMTCENSF